ncbi:MAG: sulfatase [Candidatus Aminicenantaceae bacterium]
MKTKICILSCLGMVLISCSQPREAGIFDLFREFPHAQVMAAEDHLELFQTWTTRARMFGWTRNREVDKSAILISTNRDRAVFRFGAVQRKDQRIQLKLRCLLPPATGPAPVLSIHLNGHPIHSAPFHGIEFQELTLSAPEEYLLFGENYLEFGCTPLPEQTGDKNWLALQSFRFMGADSVFFPWDVLEPQLVKPVTEKGLFSRKNGLALPPNSSLAYVLKIPPEASLAFDYSFDAARQDQAYGERLVIGLSTSSGESAVLFNQELESGRRSGRSRATLDLSVYRDQVCRVSFAFLSDLPRERSSAMVQISNAGITSRAGKGAPVEKPPLEAAPSLPFNIMIYLVDCLRPDHLPFFGYSRDTAPHMAEFVKDSVLFRQAYAQSSWTRPSVGVLFTGLYPFQHMAIDLKSGLAKEHQTLAEILKQAGYHTLGISSNAGIKQFFNFDQGFSYFKYHSNLEGGTAETLNTYAFAQLQEKPMPFFLYIHTMEPHRPYQLKEEFIPVFTKEELQEHSRIVEVEGLGRIDLYQLVAQYDATIAQNDRSFGELMTELKQLGLYDETLIVLMSDHGEQFYEHGGFAHGQNLYQESVRHLFVVKLPHQTNAGRVIVENVQEIDILPTLLDLAGLAVPRYCAGKSLRDLLLSPTLSGAPFHSEIFLETGVDLNHKAVVAGHLKLIHIGREWSDDLREYELFDLEHDPGERVNLIGRNPIAATYLKGRLSGWAQAQEKLAAIGKEDIEKTLTEKEIQELKALGYIK